MPAGICAFGGVIQLNRPVMMDCAIPARMNSETPLPIPHFETTSSMYTIRTPPMNSWMKMRNAIKPRETPSCSAITGFGLRKPPSI